MHNNTHIHSYNKPKSLFSVNASKILLQILILAEFYTVDCYQTTGYRTMSLNSLLFNIASYCEVSFCKLQQLQCLYHGCINLFWTFVFHSLFHYSEGDDWLYAFHGFSLKLGWLQRCFSGYYLLEKLNNVYEIVNCISPIDSCQGASFDEQFFHNFCSGCRGAALYF